MNQKCQVNLRSTCLGLSLLAFFYAAQSQAISLQEAYQLSLHSDPELQQASSRLLISQENIIQAKAALLPTIDGQVVANWQDESDVRSTNSEAYVISLAQPIYSPALSSAYNKVKIIQQQADLELQQSRQKLILSITQAYLDAMLAHENLTNSRAQERSTEQRLKRINVEFEAGVIAITDVHEAKASYDGAQVNLIISEGELQNSLEALQRLTGIEVLDTHRLSDNYHAENLSPLDIDHWVTLAIANNLDILLGKMSIESAQQDTNIANSQRNLYVDLQASHTRTNHSFSGTRTNNQVSVVLNLPLYNAGSLSSRVRQAMSEQNIAKYRQQDSIRAVTQITRSITRDIRTNVLSINARKQSIISITAAFEAISVGFSAGTRNIVDLLLAEQAVYNAKNQYANARLNHVRLNFLLKYQLGNLDQSAIDDLSQWLEEE